MHHSYLQQFTKPASIKCGMFAIKWQQTKCNEHIITAHRRNEWQHYDTASTLYNASLASCRTSPLCLIHWLNSPPAVITETKTLNNNYVKTAESRKQFSRTHLGILQAENPTKSTASMCQWWNLRLSGWRRRRIRIPVLHWTHFHVFCLQPKHTHLPHRNI